MKSRGKNRFILTLTDLGVVGIIVGIYIAAMFFVGAPASMRPWITSASAVLATIAIIGLLHKQQTSLVQQLQEDPQTRFFLRRLLPKYYKKEKKNLFVVFVHSPTLEVIADQAGSQSELQAIELYALIVKKEFAILEPRVYRYGEHTALMIIDSDLSIQDMVIQLGKITQGIYQVPVPVSGMSGLVNLTLHIGVAHDTTEKGDIHVLAEQARFANKQARLSVGTDPSVRIFQKETYHAEQEVRRRRLKVIETIEQARIYSVFQPIQNIHTGELFGYEALSRPTDPAFAHIAQLLDDAEAVGFYNNLEIALTHRAVTSYREKLKTLGSDIPGTPRMFLNMAPHAIKSRVYDTDINRGLFDGIKFVVEVVERGEVLPDLIKTLRETVMPIKAAIALDDFGTGYSNHLALLNTKPDIIKVARELLIDIDKDMDKQYVYTNIVVFARNLNTKVLAEGVETEAEFETLLRLGMDYCQGWFVGKPSEDLVDVSPISKRLCKEFTT